MGQGLTALHVAASAGNPLTVRAIIAWAEQEGATEQSRRADDAGLIVRAIKKTSGSLRRGKRSNAGGKASSREAFVRKLINAENALSQTPLMLAAAAGQTEIVEALLQKVGDKVLVGVLGWLGKHVSRSGGNTTAATFSWWQTITY